MKIFSKPQKDGGGESGVPGDKSGNFITYHVTDDKDNIIHTGKAKGGEFNNHTGEHTDRLQEDINSKIHSELSKDSMEQAVRDSKK